MTCSPEWNSYYISADAIVTFSRQLNPEVSAKMSFKEFIILYLKIAKGGHRGRVLLLSSQFLSFFPKSSYIFNKRPMGHNAHLSLLL